VEVSVSPAKIIRRLILGSLIAIPWIVAFDVGMVWLAQACRLLDVMQDAPMITWRLGPHLFPALFLLGWAGLSASMMRVRFRSGLRLEEREIRFAGGSSALAGPSYVERGVLVVTTASGPILLEDNYTQSLRKLCDTLNEVWRKGGESSSFRSRLVELTRHGVEDFDGWVAALSSHHGAGRTVLQDRKICWHISRGWLIPPMVALMFIKGALEDKPSGERRDPGSKVTYGILIEALEVGRNAALTLFAGFVGFPWILFTLKDPSRRYRSWVVVSRDYLIVAHDDFRIIPTRAVLDICPVPGRMRWRDLGIRCKNSTLIRFPNLLLEREADLACGLDPERFIPLAECARRLRCSKIKAWFITVSRKSLRGLSGNINRAKFEEFLTQLDCPRPGMSLRWWYPEK
jgi:hypothetical protein